jgi:hypothetical protein
VLEPWDVGCHLRYPLSASEGRFRGRVEASRTTRVQGHESTALRPLRAFFFSFAATIYRFKPSLASGCGNPTRVVKLAGNNEPIFTPQNPPSSWPNCL